VYFLEKLQACDVEIETFFKNSDIYLIECNTNKNLF